MSFPENTSGANALSKIESMEDLLKLLEKNGLSSLLNADVKPKSLSKPKRTADPNKPKRGKSAYLFYTHSTETKSAFKEYVDACVADAKSALGEVDEDDEEGMAAAEATLVAAAAKWDEEKQRPKPITELTKFAAGQWKQMDEEAKAPYTKLASAEKERYDSEMSEYRPTPSVVAALDDSDMPEAPDGWSGPFQGYYLFKNAAGRATYKSFADAATAADKLDDCLGITKTPQGHYSLRKMDGGHPLPTDKYPAVSWVKGDVEVTKMEVSTTTKKSEPVVETDASPDVDADVDAYVDAVADADADALLAETHNDTAHPEDVEQGEDANDDDFDPNYDVETDDDVPEVSRWTYQETEYLVDEASGVVYDSEKFENDGEVVEIGQRVPNTPEGKFVATDD